MKLTPSQKHRKRQRLTVIKNKKTLRMLRLSKKSDINKCAYFSIFFGEAVSYIVYDRHKTTQINRCDITINNRPKLSVPPKGSHRNLSQPHHATLRFRRSSHSGFYPLLPISCGSHHAEASYYYVACTQRHNTKKYVLRVLRHAFYFGNFANTIFAKQKVGCLLRHSSEEIL